MFHFNLITDEDQEHIGSLDLENKASVLPSGIKLVARLLARAALRKDSVKGWFVQATDASGEVVYNFQISRDSARDGPSGYVH